MVRGVSTPIRSRYGAGRTPCAATQSCTSPSVREMDVHAEVTLRRQVGNPMQRLLADQIDGVRPQRRRDAGTGVGEGIERPLGVGAQGIRLAGVEAVDER